MQPPKQPFFEEDVLEDEEIDTLFMRLEELEPPVDFIQQMLQTFACLPLPQILEEESKKRWDEIEGVVIHCEPESPA